VTQDSAESEDIRLIFDERRDTVLTIFENLVRVKNENQIKEDQRQLDEITKAPADATETVLVA
jgi:hypothetical protein